MMLPMRKWAVATLVGLAVATSGCSWLCGQVVPRHAVVGLKANLDEILPQYRAYVEADDSIQPVTKRTRLRSADVTAELVAAAVGGE